MDPKCQSSYISIYFALLIIANTEIVLDPINSVIKRLWCTLLFFVEKM